MLSMHLLVPLTALTPAVAYTDESAPASDADDDDHNLIPKFDPERPEAAVLHLLYILCRLNEKDGAECSVNIVSYCLQRGTWSKWSHQLGTVNSPHTFLNRMSGVATNVLKLIDGYIAGLEELHAVIGLHRDAAVAAVRSRMALIATNYPIAIKTFTEHQEVQLLCFAIEVDKREAKELRSLLERWLSSTTPKPSAAQAFNLLHQYLAYAVRTSSSLLAAYTAPTVQRHMLRVDGAAVNPLHHFRQLYQPDAHSREIKRHKHLEGHGGESLYQQSQYSSAPPPGGAPQRYGPPPNHSGFAPGHHAHQPPAPMPRHGVMRAQMIQMIKERGGLVPNARSDRPVAKLCSAFHMYGHCKAGHGKTFCVTKQNGAKYSHLCPCGATKPHPLVSCSKAFMSDAYGPPSKSKRGKNRRK